MNEIVRPKLESLCSLFVMFYSRNVLSFTIVILNMIVFLFITPRPVLCLPLTNTTVDCAIVRQYGGKTFDKTAFTEGRWQNIKASRDVGMCITFAIPLPALESNRQTRRDGVFGGEGHIISWRLNTALVYCSWNTSETDSFHFL